MSYPSVNRDSSSTATAISMTMAESPIHSASYSLALKVFIMLLFHIRAF